MNIGKMNIERFHNQLALRLGCDRIVNNKGIAIKVEYDNPNDPWIVIELLGGVTEGFNASEEPMEVSQKFSQSGHFSKIGGDMLQQDIRVIVEAAHQAYIEATANIYSKYVRSPFASSMINDCIKYL